MKNIKETMIGMGLFTILFIGLVLVFQYPLTLWLVGNNSHESNIMQYSTQTLKDNQKKKANFDTANIKTVNFLDVAEAQMMSQSYPTIGVLAYPEVDISLPIFNGDGDTTMLYGAGTMKANQQMGMGNYALASHHVSNVVGHWADGLLFSPLVKAKVGQLVYLTDKTKVYTYQTTKVFNVKTDQGEVILDEKGKKELTLITCATDDTYRIVVQAELKETSDFNAQNAKIFTSNYTQYWK